MRYFYLIIISVLLSACTYPYTVPLTPEGKRVILVGSELPLLLPGKPLDKCSILSNLYIYLSSSYRIYIPGSWDNDLRNKTAELRGNVAIKIRMEYGSGTPNITSMQGIALNCPEEVLKAAGLSNIRESLIEGRKASYQEWQGH